MCVCMALLTVVCFIFCTVCVQCLLRPAEGVRASGTELPFGCCESNLISLQRQSVLLSELAPQAEGA